MYTKSIKSILVFGLLAVALLLAACTADEPEEVLEPAEPGLHGVAVDEDQIVISGGLTDEQNVEGAKLTVYEFNTEEAVDFSGRQSVAQAEAPFELNGFSFTLDRYDTNQRDLYYSKFLIVYEGVNEEGIQQAVEPLFLESYVTETLFAAKYDFAFPETSSKKGLQVQMLDDAEELGISHAGLNFVLNSMMLASEPENIGNVLTHELDGETYYFSKFAVEGYDNQIKALSDAGILVNLIILITETNHPLIHPDADFSGGPIYAFNTKTQEGVQYLKAAAEFITERYTREDERYGRAVGYIIGNEVDSHWVWSNMGKVTAAEFIPQYERALRIFYQAARKHYEEARVYISLTHSWTEPHQALPLQFIPGRDVLTGINDITKMYGDYPWHIAHHPYPQNLREARFWNDHKATQSEDTLVVTFNNLEVLNDYILKDELLIHGDARRVILSEQGFDTRSYSEEGQMVQAAAYAFAYYKVDALENIDSFILHRHVDHRGEGGLRLGLWGWDVNSNATSHPFFQKYIYDVFKYIDTERTLEVSAFALEIIGYDSWEEAIPGFSVDQIKMRRVPENLPSMLVQVPAYRTAIDTFEDGIGNWRHTANTTSVGHSPAGGLTGDGALNSSFGAVGKLWRGAEVKWDSSIDASSAEYLNVRLMLPGADASREFEVKVKLYGANGELADSEIIALPEPTEWNDVAVELGKWSGREHIERIKVWVRSPGDAGWGGSMLLDEVYLTNDVAEFISSAYRFSISVEGDSPEIGESIRITVVNNDQVSISGELLLSSSERINLSESSIPVMELAAGDSFTTQVQISNFDVAGEGDLTITAEYLGRSAVLALSYTVVYTSNQLPGNVTLLYNFEDGVEGWQAGDHVSSLGSGSSFLNGPGHALLDNKALVAIASTVAADQWKIIYVDFDNPLDFTGYTNFSYFFNSYGGVPGSGIEYQTRLIIRDGSNEFAVVTTIKPDQWSRIRIPIADIGLSQADGIEISFRAAGTDFGWAPNFQIDYVALEE